MAERVFTADYVEHVKLRDGTPALVRLVRPEDKPLLARGFERWSEASRQARFLTPKDRLTDEELAYLTEVDQEHHFALGAIREPGDEREPVGLGIARFIRLPDRPSEPVTAEPAIGVADEVQHQGLGRILLTRLVAAAAERGIERFRFEVLCSNESMRALLDEVAPDNLVRHGEDVITVDFPIPATPPLPAPESALYRFFRAIAQNAEAACRLWQR